MAKAIRLTFLLVLVLSLVGCDHATKLLAERTLAGAAPIELVPGLLELRYAPNHDVAFSLLRHFELPFSGLGGLDKRWLLVTLTLVATAALGAIAWRRRFQTTVVERITWTAVFAGALGNVGDRIFRGYVVDFVRLPHWPIFNLADVFIVVGMIALALSIHARARPSRAG